MEVQFNDSSQHNYFEEEFENVDYENIIKKFVAKRYRKINFK